MADGGVFVFRITSDGKAFVVDMNANTKSTVELKQAAADTGKEVKALGQSVTEVERAAKAGGKQARQTKDDVADLGKSAKQSANELRQVAPQITDIVTSLASGQSPMMVMIQQGGQLKDVFGGVGPAARAVSGYILGMINPISVAAVAVSGLALAWYQGSKQVSEFTNNILLSGNATGKTIGDLRGIAVSLAEINSTSQGAALDGLSQMALQGKVAGDNLERYTSIAQKLDKLVGKPVADTVSEFAALAGAPVDASLKLTEKYNYLTASVYSQIKALKDQGREQEAVKLAQETFASSVEARIPGIVANVGLVERAWNAVAGAIKWVGDRILDVGRPETLQQQIATARQLLQERQDRNKALGIKDGAATDELKQTIANLQEMERLQKRTAQSAADRASGAKDEADALKLIDDSLTRQQKMNRELEQARNKLAAARMLDKLPAVEANIRLKYYSPDADNAKIEKLRQGLALSEDATKASIDRIQAAYKAGALSEIQSIEQVGEAELKQLERAKVVTQDELERAKAKKDSLTEQASLTGKLAMLEQQITERPQKTQREVDLAKEQGRRREEQALQEERAKTAAEWGEQSRKDTELKNAARAATQKYVQSLEDESDEVRHQASLIGLSTREAALANEQRRIQVALTKELRDIDSRTGLAFEDSQSLKEAARAAATRAAAQADGKIQIEEQAKTNERISAGLADALASAGRDGGAKLRSFIEQELSRPFTVGIQAALQPVSQAISGFVTGGVNSISQSLGLSNLLGTAGTASSAAMVTANTALGSTLGMSAGEAAAAASAAGQAGAAGAAGAGALSAAEPYVAAAMIAYSLLSGDKGGPKDEGGADLAAGLTSQYAALAGKVGAKDVVRFGAAYAKDPAGNSQTQLNLAAFSSDKQVYSRADRFAGEYENVGRSAEEFAAAWAEDASRAMLAALQADGGLEPELRQIVAGTDAYSASIAEVNAALTRVQTAGEQRTALEEQYFQMTATEVQKLERTRKTEREATDATNSALRERIYLEQDLKTKAEATRVALAAAAQSYFTSLDNSRTASTLNTEAGAAVDAFFGRAASVARSQYEGQAAAAQAAASVAQQAASNWQSIASTLRSTLDGAKRQTEEVLNTPFTALYSRFKSLQVLAAGGDAGAATKLADVAQLALSASERQSSTREEFLRDRARITTGLSRTVTVAEAQVLVQQSIAAASSAQVTELQALNVTLSGFAKDALELLSKGYTGADQATASGAVSKLAQMTADYASFFSSSKEGDTIAGIGGSKFTRLAGDAGSFTDASGAVSYFRQSDSIIQTAKQNPALRAYWQSQYGVALPAFAAGGSHAGGLAVVGERGWEMADFSAPARIYNHTDSVGIAGALNDLPRQMAALREQLADQERSIDAIAISNAALLKLLSRVVPTGDYVLTKVAT